MVAPKNYIFVVRLITSSNIDQFSNFFSLSESGKICNSIVTKDPTTPQFVATIPCEISVSEEQQLKTRRLL